MASTSDLSKMEHRTMAKAPIAAVSTSKKFSEPFNRLKNRANLFRRKNYSSQLNISSRPSSGTEHIVPSDRPLPSNDKYQPDVVLLKRSNSMICPQQRLQSLLNQRHTNHHQHRNSICLELAGCSTDESSTDDYQLSKSSLNRYWNKQICSTMSHIDENEPIPSAITMTMTTTTACLPTQSNQEDQYPSEDNVSLLSNNHNNSQQDNNNDEDDTHQTSEQGSDITLPSSSSSSVMDTQHPHLLSQQQNERAHEEKQRQPREEILSLTNGTSLISSSHLSSSSSPSTVILRDHAEVIRTRRQCHSSISILQHQPRQAAASLSASFEDPLFDSKPIRSADKPNLIMELSSSKVSTCTMTGKSLNNLDECSSTTSSEEKAVQTATNELNQSQQLPSSIKRTISTASLSSSSAVSIQTDLQEKKSSVSNNTKSAVAHPAESLAYKWPHLHERLLGEQTCTYWVNYLGSTAIKMSDDGLTAMPSQAIARLKQSTQYARVLPIIGLNISSRGVEFLKHTKDRVVICFHDIKTIHCACQDQDLRYFAYVTREQRLVHGLNHANNSNGLNHDQKQSSPPSPSLSIGSDFHHYCHVFVVKSEAMSTEIMLTFGQVFDLAYRLHRRLKSNGKKSKEIHSLLNADEAHHPQLEVIRLSTKSDINTLMSSSTHSPASSSSSSSIDERKIFI